MQVLAPFFSISRWKRQWGWKHKAWQWAGCLEQCAKSGDLTHMCLPAQRETKTHVDKTQPQKMESWCAIAPWYIINHLLQRESWAWNEWKGYWCSKPFAVFDCHAVSKSQHWLDSATPCQAKQHLHCSNYAFKDWSGTKETQKTQFFSASYYEDHWWGWSSFHLSWRNRATWQGNIFAFTKTVNLGFSVLSSLDLKPSVFVDVLGKWQKTFIHNRIAGDSWGAVSWNDGKGFFVDIWLDYFYLSDDLIAPGVLLKY